MLMDGTVREMTDSPLQPNAPPLAATRLSSPSTGIVFAALMLVMLLASLDGTVVSTALPTIVAEFGGLAHLSWIVTAYMLAQTVVTPVYGKMGDLFGRKIVLQSAIVIFLIGSVLCGTSQSMGQLITFRAVQGLGGGGLVVVTMAAVADIVPPRERGRYQGYFGAVYGLSTIIGPVIGGFFVQHLTWRWIFYINLPLGMIALLVIGIVFSSPPTRARPAIDVAGTLLLAVMLTSLVILTSLGGSALASTSPTILLLIVLTIMSLVAFVVIERRAEEPILPPRLFVNPTFLVASTTSFIVGLAMFGSVTYLPIYLQVVQGVDPSTAGLLLSPMMAGVLVASVLGGQFTSRVGRYRILPILGTGIMTIALGLLSSLGAESATRAVSAYALLLGIGIGMTMQVLVLAVQNAVEYRDLGVATSGATLFRSTGGSVGVALFGAIFTANLASGLATRLPHGPSLPTATDAQTVAALPVELRRLYIAIFTDALQPVFVAAAVMAALAFLLTLLLKEIPLRDTARAETLAESFAMPHDASSLEELEAIVRRLGQRENRADAYRRIAASAGVGLSPGEIWLLGQLSRARSPMTNEDLATRAAIPRARVEDIAKQLAAARLIITDSAGALNVSAEGRRAQDHIVAIFRIRAAAFIERWSPEDHADVKAMLDRLARDLAAEMPADKAL